MVCFCLTKGVGLAISGHAAAAHAADHPPRPQVAQPAGGQALAREGVRLQPLARGDQRAGQNLLHLRQQPALARARGHLHPGAPTCPHMLEPAGTFPHTPHSVYALRAINCTLPIVAGTACNLIICYAIICSIMARMRISCACSLPKRQMGWHVHPSLKIAERGTIGAQKA